MEHCREAGFHRENAGGGCWEAVCSPSLDLVPEDVKAGHGACTVCEKVCAIQQDVGNQSCCKPVA